MTVSSQELDELRDTVRKFLSAKMPEARVRDLMETRDAFDAEVWSQMQDMLGLHSLLVPEEYGGDGAELPVVATVFEELGRSLAPVPYLANFVAVQALLRSAAPALCERYLPGFADGSLRGTVAVAERDGTWDAETIHAEADRQADGPWRLTGMKAWVLNATTAHLLLVFARTRTGVALFVVDSPSAGLRIEPMRVMDATRPLARVHFDSAEADLVVGDDMAARRLLNEVTDLTCLGLAAEQVGLAQRCLELAVEHAKVRIQFDRPIGAFQAVKHMCSEMLAQVELARAATEDAVRRAHECSAASPAAISAAHITASAAATFVTREAIQVLGGIGFTWDHVAHLYFRRAAASDLLLGGPASSGERLLARLDI